MPRQELRDELQIRERELTEELEAIQKLLNGIGEPSSNGKAPKPSGSNGAVKTFFGAAKGKTKWPAYLKIVLKGIGGKGRVRDIADAVVKANPKMPPSTVLASVRSVMPKLNKDGEVDCIESTESNGGYIYKSKK